MAIVNVQQEQLDILAGIILRAAKQHANRAMNALPYTRDRLFSGLLVVSLFPSTKTKLSASVRWYPKGNSAKLDVVLDAVEALPEGGKAVAHAFDEVAEHAFHGALTDIEVMLFAQSHCVHFRNLDFNTEDYSSIAPLEV